MPPKRVIPFRVPDELLSNPSLNEAILSTLPKNYNFEIHKTIWRIICLRAHRVALQLPEGLLMFAIPIAQILSRFSTMNIVALQKALTEPPDIAILGDVTYGACCVDDYIANALDADLLVHYGHSCLIPLESPSVLYVFVDIGIDLAHFIQSVESNFDKISHLTLVSTIQFVTSLQASKKALQECGFRVNIPQTAPLSPGEVLGCTSPKIENSDAIIYLGDGRFHLESVMIANPTSHVYSYDPYSKSITREFYDHVLMRSRREDAISIVRRAEKFGLILGSLGRQGSPAVLQQIQSRLDELNKTYVVFLFSEIFPSKLALFDDQIDAWIQVACPRLSIDWGSEFSKPILTPYEAAVALDLVEWLPSLDEAYPMDYYANNSLGPWTPNHINNRNNKSHSNRKIVKSDT